MSTGLPALAALVCVALGGASGAVLRYLATASRIGGLGGTLLVNVVGSFLLGVLAGVAEALPAWLFLLLGTGLAGALTTWSALAVHTWRLGQDSWRRGAAYLTLTLGLGVTAAALGLALAWSLPSS